MRKAGWLAATALALGVAAAPASASASARPVATPPDYAHPIHSDQAFTLQSNTTQTYAMRINGLGTDANTMLPCDGFEIRGEGVSIAAGDLNLFGPVYPESGHESEPNGGIPGATQQPDGAFAVPDSHAVLDARTLAMGENCAAIDWDFYAPDGEPRLDPYGNPIVKTGVTSARAASAKARKKAKARQRKVLHRAKRKMHGAAATTGGVSVTLAGLRNIPGNPWGAEIVVTVQTGTLAGPTTLKTHARVLPQRLDK